MIILKNETYLYFFKKIPAKKKYDKLLFNVLLF
jgi:hypothetical protein